MCHRAIVSGQKSGPFFGGPLRLLAGDRGGSEISEQSCPLHRMQMHINAPQPVQVADDLLGGVIQRFSGGAAVVQNE